MGKVVFISGPYRAKTQSEIEVNINHARKAAIRIWQSGDYAICPHLNTANFDGECPDDVWLEGDLEFLRRADAIYMLKDWRKSEGAKIEYQKALEWGKQVIFEVLPL